ncbi:hypothetical protein SFRURICE_005345 [Spodoptera frugiperda]|nr:hypothetical protein SFRURICE_005345 [Spodoptera frugiperda]
MPQCVFKSCKNNARKSNSSAGVSYFRFPSNPFTCAEWVSIVAREREDNFYKPAKNSIICSDHFDKSDISGNTNRRRLVKTAVPNITTYIILTKLLRSYYKSIMLYSIPPVVIFDKAN